MPHEGPADLPPDSQRAWIRTSWTCPSRDHAGEVGGELNAAVARAAVRVHRWHAGRGPTKARAFFRHDVVVAVLEDALTVTERSLIADDRRDAVARCESSSTRRCGPRWPTPSRR